jgi:hypothetical protein
MVDKYVPIYYFPSLPPPGPLEPLERKRNLTNKRSSPPPLNKKRSIDIKNFPTFWHAVFWTEVLTP